MNLALKYCRCCYDCEEVKRLSSPALEVYGLICNTEGLEDEDSQIATCSQCCEFLEKVFRFKFECASVDDIFRNELNVKHQKVESTLNDAVDESPQSVTGTNGVEVDSDPKNSHIFPESLLVSDKMKWEPLDDSSDPVENNLLIELCHEDQQTQSNKIRGKRNSLTAEHLYNSKAAKRLCTPLENVHSNESLEVCDDFELKSESNNHSIIHSERKLILSIERCDEINKSTQKVVDSQTESANEKSASFDFVKLKKKIALENNLSVYCEKPFKCSECPYETTTQYKLKVHFVKKHSGDRPFSCDRCNYSSKTKYDLKRHKMIHLDVAEYPYKCKECSSKATTLTSLKLHIACKHNDDRPFNCDQCNYSAKIKQNLVRHKRIHLDVTENPHKCNECSYKTTTLTKLKLHIARKHNDGRSFNCDRCNYSAKIKRYLTRHKMIHLDTTEKPYKCIECSYTSTDPTNLKIHIAHRHSTEKPFKCNECSHTTADPKNLRRHIARKHNDDRSFNCDRCNYSAKTKSNLTRHKMIHLDTAEKPYKCNECSYTSTDPTNLKIHIANRHSNDRPFSCDRCSYSAKTKRTLKMHKMIHLDTTEKPYKCNECSYNTTTLTYLKQHIARRHSDDKPFICDHCNYSTRTKENLLRHIINNHTDNIHKSFKCSECSFKATTNTRLRRHIAHRHSNERPFSCDLCSYSAKTKEDLRGHKTRIHPDRMQQLSRN